MSLQMPPDGGSYRDRHGDVSLPPDLIAKTAQGEPVRLPDRVSAAILEYVPSSVAREFCALPVGQTEWGELRILLAEGATDLVDAIRQLGFILNRQIEPCFAPRAEVGALIERAYLFGTIENCDFRYSDWCPKRFEKLTPTGDLRCRLCPVCSSPVRYCDSDETLRVRSAAGLVSARPDPEPGMIQEFVDVEVDVEESPDPLPPLDLRAMFGSPAPRRPRYEILDLPDFFRQEREAAERTERDAEGS